MNFYKHHIGDYQKKTAHLTLAEHGAYLLMLHHYYATETPLPLPGRDLYRMLRAHSKVDHEAIKSVAKQFWQSTDGGLINGRANEELQKADGQRRHNQIVGKLGGRPKITQVVSKNNPSGFNLETQVVLKNNPIQTNYEGQKQRQKNSEPNGSGGKPPNPDVETIFANGVALLQSAGVSDRNARSMLGLMRKQHGDKAVADALRRCAEVQAIEPVAWMQAALKSKSGVPTAASIAAEAMRLHDAREVANAT